MQQDWALHAGLLTCRAALAAPSHLGCLNVNHAMSSSSANSARSSLMKCCLTCWVQRARDSADTCIAYMHHIGRELVSLENACASGSEQFCRPAHITAHVRRYGCALCSSEVIVWFTVWTTQLASFGCLRHPSSAQPSSSQSRIYHWLLQRGQICQVQLLPNVKNMHATGHEKSLILSNTHTRQDTGKLLAELFQCKREAYIFYQSTQKRGKYN